MWLDLAFRLFNFAVFAFIIYYFARRPVSSFLQKRRETIKETIEGAEQAKRQWEEVCSEYEKKLRLLNEQIEQIRQQIIKEGERERERIIREARELAEKIKRQAELVAQQELMMVKGRTQRELAEMVVQLAEELLKKHMQPQDHERLVDEYIRQLEMIHWSAGRLPSVMPRP